MKLEFLAFSAIVQLASCWPVQEFFYLETQLQGGQVLTLSHGSPLMQHKQRLDTQLWGIDEETGCLRSKTSEYMCLTASDTGSVSFASENGEPGQQWEMSEDGAGPGRDLGGRAARVGQCSGGGQKPRLYSVA